MPQHHSGAVIGRPETTSLILLPISKVVWQQSQQIRSTNIPTTETHKNTHMHKFKQRNDVESQISAIKKSQPQFPDPIQKQCWKSNWEDANTEPQ